MMGPRTHAYNKVTQREMVAWQGVTTSYNIQEMNYIQVKK